MEFHATACGIGADVVEWIKLKRKKIESRSSASNIFQKPIHPGTIS